MPGDFSEELVELVISVLPVDPFDGTIPVEYDDHGIPCWGQPQKVARAILAALSSSGRLVPEGSEVREEWGVRTQRNGEDDDLRASNLDRAKFWATAQGGSIIRRRVVTTPWTPAEPAQETPNA